MANTIEIKVTADPRAESDAAKAAPSPSHPAPTASSQQGGMVITPGAWEQMQKAESRNANQPARGIESEGKRGATQQDFLEVGMERAAADAERERKDRDANREYRKKEREDRAEQRAEEKYAEANMSYEDRVERDAKRNIERERRRKDVAEKQTELNPPTVQGYEPPSSGKTAQPRGTGAKAKQQQQFGQVMGGAGVEDVNMATQAAMGNPAAAVMLAIKAVEKVKQDVGDMVRAPADIAEGVAKPVESMARGDNAKALGEATEGLVELGKKTPMVGEAFGVVADTGMRLGKTFSGLVDAFVERGRQISGFSGETASSFATSDVRQMMADIKEAQNLGANFARLNDAQTDLSIMLRDFLLPIKDAIIGRLANVLEKIERWAERNQDTLVEARTNLLNVKLQLEILVAHAELDYSEYKKKKAELKQAIVDAIRESHQDNIQDVRKEWMDAVQRKLNPPGGMPIQRQGGIRGPDPRPRIPIIGGA